MLLRVHWVIMIRCTHTYVKLIGNDDSHFYSFKAVLLNYAVICCIEAHAKSFVITNEIDYCGT